MRCYELRSSLAWRVSFDKVIVTHGHIQRIWNPPHEEPRRNLEVPAAVKAVNKAQRFGLCSIPKRHRIDGPVRELLQRFDNARDRRPPQKQRRKLCRFVTALRAQQRPEGGEAGSTARKYC